MRDSLTTPDLGDCPALPVDFEPQRSAPVPLDEPRDIEPMVLIDRRRGDPEPSVWVACSGRETFERVIGPSLLCTALAIALASCAFLGWRA